MNLNQMKALANGVIGRLRGQHVDALHVGALAFQGWQPAVGYAFDDLQLLVKEDDLGRADSAMTGGGYVRVTWAGGVPQPVAGPVAPPSPVTPDVAYSGQPGAHDPPLWIQIHTTRRHGPLLLVDLENWFDHAVAVHEMAGHLRPPDWALLLWQASLVTNAASDCSSTVTREVGKLGEVAARCDRPDWNRVLRRAGDYDREYLVRLERFRSRIEAYAGDHDVAPGRLISPAGDAESLDYGVMYDLRHALEALNAFPPQGPPVVPPAVMVQLHQGTGARLRKIWDPTGRLGIARFSIHDQVTAAPYAGLTAEQLFLGGHVHADIPDAPQHGYWGH